MDQGHVERRVVATVLARDGVNDHGTHRKLAGGQLAQRLVERVADAVVIGEEKRRFYEKRGNAGVLTHDHVQLSGLLRVLD